MLTSLASCSLFAPNQGLRRTSRGLSPAVLARKVVGFANPPRPWPEVVAVLRSLLVFGQAHSPRTLRFSGGDRFDLPPGLRGIPLLSPLAVGSWVAITAWNEVLGRYPRLRHGLFIWRMTHSSWQLDFLCV